MYEFISINSSVIVSSWPVPQPNITFASLVARKSRVKQLERLAEKQFHPRKLIVFHGNPSAVENQQDGSELLNEQLMSLHVRKNSRGFPWGNLISCKKTIRR